MAKPILVRKSFNAGELSPELHYRDDLAAYVKGCKNLSNMVPTPYGAATRRPPFELLAKINTDLFGIPVRYIPFKFSLDEVFHIIFTDGSGSESTDPTTADLIIFNADGSQVIFDGVPGPLSVLPGVLPQTLSSGVVAMASTIYDPADLGEIHYINVNDFVYMTCGGKYPVQVINRFYDEAEGGNRWKIEEWSIVGLLGDVNLNTTNTVYIHGDTWEAGATYEENAHVSVGSDDIAITDSGWTYRRVSGVFYHEYYIRITLASGTYSPGETITVENLVVSALNWSDPVYWGEFGDSPDEIKVGDVVSGAYSIVSVDGLSVTINQSAHAGNLAGSSNYPSFDETSASGSLVSAASGVTFFRSLQDGNTGNAVTDSAWWAEVPYYEGLLECESNSDLFSEGDVGRELSIAITDNNTISGTWEANQTSDAINAYGVVEMITEGGVWNGTLTLETSNDGGDSWVATKSITSNQGSSNGSVEVDLFEINTLVRATLTDWATWSGTSDPKLKFKVVLKDEVRYHVRILEYIDSRNVVVQTITPFLTEVSDYRYSLGEFSGTTGYPYALTIHDERLCLGGSRLKPNTVFASRVNDWGDYLKGTTETAPYTFTIASDSFDTIRSLKSSRQLNIMTDNAENTMGSRDDNAITSVTNISVSSHTNYGSSNVQAIQMADMIWFTMGQSERVRASRYDFASDGQQSIEMSLFASHITESGIKEMSFRRHPFNSLFCLLNNGSAATLTYEGMQEVKAWARISTEGGSILSAASNYSDTGDIVAGIVERGGSYFLETFGDIDEATVFLDNQTTWIDADFTIGQPIKQDDDGFLVVVHDDEELTEGVDYTIAGGLLTIPGVTTGAVAIGRKYVSRINPTDIAEVAPSGLVKRLTSLGMYLLDSGTCEIKINGKESPFTDGLKWGAGDRESGLFDVSTGGDYEQGLDIDITIDSHRHFTITGLGYRLSISDG